MPKKRSTPKGTKGQALSTDDPDLAIKQLYRLYLAKIRQFSPIAKRSPESLRHANALFNDYVMHRAALGFVKPPKGGEWSKLFEWRDAMKALNEAHTAAAFLIHAWLADYDIAGSPIQLMARQAQRGTVDPDVELKCDGLLDELAVRIAGDSAEPKELAAALDIESGTAESENSGKPAESKADAASADNALRELGSGGALSPRELAKKFGVPQRALEARLSRERAKNHNCFIENTEAPPREARFLYKFNAIKHIIDALRAKHTNSMPHGACNERATKTRIPRRR